MPLNSIWSSLLIQYPLNEVRADNEVAHENDGWRLRGPMGRIKESMDVPGITGDQRPPDEAMNFPGKMHFGDAREESSTKRLERYSIARNPRWRRR